jgi:hypothetical protein
MIGWMWRKEDDALLERLEDEILFEQLWRFQAGSAEPPHPRAAGMISLVRRMSGGPEAISEAREGRFDPFFSKLLPPRIDSLSPELIHHLALYYGSLADALAAATSAPEPPLEARKRSLAAWLALGAEKRYLVGLAEAIASGALPADELARAALEASMEPIEDLGRAAKEGAHELTQKSWLALAALASVEAACRAANLPSALADAAIRRADRLRVAAADEALNPIREALAEATARGDVQAKAPALFQRVAAIWRWSGEDEAVEIFAVEQATPIAWEIQRESRWEDLRRLLGPLIPLTERLSTRVETDPTRIAYAGPCAQIYVFRYEMEDDLDRSHYYAERSVKICPTHRNGRLVLASSLCDLAIRMMNHSGWFMSPEVLANADAHVQRAEQLFPALKRIETVKARLDEARKKAGAVLK